MQGIESFIDALSLYITNNILFIVFLVAVIYILKNSNQKQRKYFIAVAVTAIVFVFNGITFAVVKRLGEDTTYYRFFWICPIVLTAAYLMIELFTEKAVTKIQKIGLLAVFCIMLFVNYGQSFNGWTSLPSNVYQIEDDIVQLGDLIDEHTGGERTILLANEYVSAHIREYNANIVINPDGMYYLDAIINGDNINYSAHNVMVYMDFNRSEYIAIEKEKIGTNRLFISIGSEKIGETDNFNLYYYDYNILEAEGELFSNTKEEKLLYVNSEYINVPGISDQKNYLYVTDIWTAESEPYKQAIIDFANEMKVEALIINCDSDNKEITPEFLEEELQGLEVPYIYNGGVQYLEADGFSIVSMKMDELSKEDNEELRHYLSLEKPVILVTDQRLDTDQDNEAGIEIALSEDSPVIEVIAGSSGSYKNMLNDNIMQYSAWDIDRDTGLKYVTLLRVKGLEAE